jgi:hypothetical protein
MPSRLVRRKSPSDNFAIVSMADFGPEVDAVINYAVGLWQPTS